MSGAPPSSLARAALPRLVAGMIGLGVLCAACDDSLVAPAAPAACTRIGQQCQRPEGPLGVCQETRCAADASPPCYACTSQH
ncbi:MAG TPA: hypothetical protein VL049_13615 [Candidatus Dormibacteraeota bacterium]|nr:hypothetical protein [Candidatus Dormibacteraeota bacterium]